MGVPGSHLGLPDRYSRLRGIRTEAQANYGLTMGLLREPRLDLHNRAGAYVSVYKLSF